MSPIWLIVLILLIIAVAGGIAISKFLFLILIIVVIVALVGGRGRALGRRAASSRARSFSPTAAGCGGKGALGQKALQQEATGLQSLAAEGGILAGDAARGRSTSVFLRVHTQYLTKAAQSSATTLAAGGPAAAPWPRREGVAHELDRLSHSGSDRAEQRRLAADLTRAARRAGEARKERVKQFLQIALGILSAIGGFVDIGDLVFNTQAGATFGFQLMWVVVIGVVGIIVYSEMCGRVAAISRRPVFDLVRERVGFGAGRSAR